MKNSIKTQVLCLDLATIMGWALQGKDGTIFSGSQSLASKKFDGAGIRYLKFKNWMDKIYENSKEIDLILYESVPFSKGGAAAQVLNGLTATLQCWCEHHQIPYEGIPVTKIKKSITGKGNAKKEDVIKEIIKKGHSPKDHNEADALAILYFYIGEENEPCS